MRKKGPGNSPHTPGIPPVFLRETTAPRISVHCLLTAYERADKRETRKPQMFETVLLAAHPTGGLTHTPIGITPYPPAGAPQHDGVRHAVSRSR